MMGHTRTWPDIHVTNIDISFAEYGAHASDHAGLIRVAAEEDISCGDKLRPIASYLDDTWLTMHYCTTQYVDVFITGAWFAREGRSVAIGIQYAHRHQVGKFGWHGRFLLDNLQPPLLRQQLRVDHVHVGIRNRFE